MTGYIKNPFLLPLVIAGLALLPAVRVAAQIFTTLHSFTGGSNDGANPQAGFIISGNTLYGTTDAGGSSGSGTMFKINTDGTGFTTLHSFTGGNDGANPDGGLVLSGNILYGTAVHGGSSGKGTVFKINTDGTGFTNVHSFTGGSDGAYPPAGLVLSGNILYGTTFQGGSSGNGTVFKVNTDGTGFTTLHHFTATPPYPNNTNSDGANPQAGLILSANTLYGTAINGGSSGNGTVFKVNADGSGFTTLHGFTAAPDFTNSDGVNPFAGLLLSGNTLYGTAEGGGSSALGTVFKVNTDGTGFTALYGFTGSGGAYPFAGLILSGNTLYGTATGGGSSSEGTVFAINTNGTGFTNLHGFTARDALDSTNSDGAGPYGGLILSGNTLYGTAKYGGSSGKGTVFSLSFTPRLTILRSGPNVVLTWPTNAAGFNLQSTTNLVSPAIWSTVSPGPVVVNGQNTVTNPISGARKFYRLIQ